MQKIVAILGPTATGKTDLALAIAKQIPADIISVDSAMVYRGMDIGTAKPDTRVLQQAPHRLIDFLDPAVPYSTGQFCADALREIRDIISHHRTPLLVGGTMLYFQKLLFGFAALPESDAVIRAQLSAEMKEQGLAAMHDRLKKSDPVAALKIKPQDPQRIQRALEVFLTTGKKISELQMQNQSGLLDEYDVTTIALIPENRVWLHDRIAKRFDQMLAAGFIDEVKKLHARCDLNATMPSMRIVGYRQAWDYLDEKTSLQTMREKAIAATRQLAKRQLTWLRRWPNLQVFDPEKTEVISQVMKKIV